MQADVPRPRRKTADPPSSSRRLSLQPALSSEELVCRMLPTASKAPQLAEPSRFAPSSPVHQAVPEDAPLEPARELSREELLKAVAPPDIVLALCASVAYGERDTGDQQPPAAAELELLSERWGIVSEGVCVDCQIEDHAVGLGMITFLMPAQTMSDGTKVAAVIFAFRGTVLSKRQNFGADLDVWRNANKDLYFAARGIKHIHYEMVRLRKKHKNVQLTYLATGHSLGGFTAAACAVAYHNEIIRTVTFESPGLTSFYHSLAEHSVPGMTKMHWADRVCNYVSIPNPINTCQRHLGRVIRVRERRRGQQPLSLSHAVRCILGTGMQLFNCLLAVKFVVGAARRWGPRAEWMADFTGIKALKFNRGDRKLARSEIVLRPASLLSGFLGYLSGNGVYMATRLSLTCHEIMQQHSMFHLTQGFDPKTGMPYSSVEMASWPRADRLHRSAPKVLASMIIESFVPLKAVATVRTILDREAMIEARVRRLPGYVELDLKAHRAGPGARLRRYMSGVIGDMQPATAMAEVSDDEEGFESDSSLSTGASEAGALWGAHMPSPFAAPQAAAPPQALPPEAVSPRRQKLRALRQRRREVHQQERACRLEMQRAITRAVEAHDFDAIGQEERNMEKQEEVMERLLTLQQLQEDELQASGRIPDDEADQAAPSGAATSYAGPQAAARPVRYPRSARHRQQGRAAYPGDAPAARGRRAIRRPDFLRNQAAILEEAVAEDDGAGMGEMSMLMSGAVFQPSQQRHVNRRRKLFAQPLEHTWEGDRLTSTEPIIRSTTMPW